MTATAPPGSHGPAVPVSRDPRAPFDLGEPLGPLERRRRGTDRLLLGSALALALIGAVLVWAATRDRHGQAYLYRHLLNVGIGIVLVAAVSRVRLRQLPRLAALGYLAALAGLGAVLLVGATINGARSWLEVGGGFELQPSEFTKVALIAAMAVLFWARAERRAERAGRRPPEHADGSSDAPTSGDVVAALALLALPLALIMLQPDLGSALVLCAASFGVLVMARVRARWLIGLAAGAGLAAVGAVRLGLLASYQLTRLGAFTNPRHDPLGAAYTINQARIAFANGGLFGTGLFRGPQTNGGFVPEQQTDFVFSVAGEEFGLIGGLVVIALLGVLCWRALVIARGSDRFGQIIAAGVACWFVMQAFENIGMNLGLTPVTGVPLPLVSYGGSAMFAEAIAIGLLVAIDRAREPG